MCLLFLRRKSLSLSCYLLFRSCGEHVGQWVKDFSASDKSQAVSELAAWLDSFGLRLTVTVKLS